MNKKLPFTVIGGYLGAGKTTLLNHLLTNTAGLRLAVLVNDFGSINIDVNLIRSHEGDTINLANGCMCCSLSDGFAVAVNQILKRSDDFDRIVIEASGVADPAKIAQYGQMYYLPLDGILVVADAEQVRTQAQNKYVGDTVLRQFAQSDLILLNKCDLVTAAERDSLRAWFAEIAPRTPVIESVQSQVPLEVLLAAHETYVTNHVTSNQSEHYSDPDLEHSDHEHDSDHDHTHLFETWTIVQVQPLNQAAMAHLALRLGEDVYRAKGFVHLQEDPEHCYIYQQVGARWSLERGSVWGNERPQTRLVIIGRRGATSPVTITASLAGKASVEFGKLSSLKHAV